MMKSGGYGALAAPLGVAAFGAAPVVVGGLGIFAGGRSSINAYNNFTGNNFLTNNNPERTKNSWSGAVDAGETLMAAVPFASKGGRDAMFGAEARSQTLQTGTQAWTGARNWSDRALNAADNLGYGAKVLATELSPAVVTPEGLMVRPPMPEAPTPRPMIPGPEKPQPMRMQSNNPEGQLPQGGISSTTPKSPATEPDVGLSNRGYRPKPGERSTTKAEYYGEDGAHRINRSANKPVSLGDTTNLSQPGGLSATEGTQITPTSGRYAGSPGPRSHPLTEHGPQVPLSQVQARVGTGRGRVGQATRFLDRAAMEEAIASNIKANQSRIDAWLRTNPSAGDKLPPLKDNPGLGNLGEGYRLNRSTGQVEKIQGSLEGTVMIVKADGMGGYVIQTAYPAQ